MHDEFLKALRRDPPPQFARRLKHQLQAHDARAQRRSWSLRTRILLALIAGSAFAGGALVLKRHSSSSSEPAQVQVRPEIAAAKPGSPGYRPRSLGPGFLPEGNGPASNSFDNSQSSTGSAANIALSDASGQTTSNAVGAATTPSEQTSGGGGLIQARAAPLSIAISPLADALIRDALSNRSEALRVQTIAAEAVFPELCAPEKERQFDMVVSSRRIAHAEFMNCRSNGLSRIIEFKLGYQALVLTTARDNASVKLSAGDLYLAVARQIPDPADLTRIIDNTNFTWDQVNSRLAYRPIAVFGPMRDTPLRLLFETLLLEPGCNAHRAIAALQVTATDRHAELCRSLRDDRLYSEVEPTANLISQTLWSDPHGFVLVDYQFYLDNRSQFAGSALEGPEPSQATFADGTYPLARPVYVYADETRTRRANDIYNDLQNLRYWLRGPNRFGFVPLEEREGGRRDPWRGRAQLTESDLITPRSTPR